MAAFRKRNGKWQAQVRIRVNSHPTVTPLSRPIMTPLGGPGEGFLQLRFLNRQLVLPVSTMSQ